MLEIRYNRNTEELTGWCGDEAQFGNLKDRGSEAIIVLDIPIPDEPLEAWLFDGEKLVPNPDYIEPPSPRNIYQEIDDLKAKIEKLEVKALERK